MLYVRSFSKRETQFFIYKVNPQTHTRTRSLTFKNVFKMSFRRLMYVIDVEKITQRNN